jgi:hypothetical protein
VGHFGLSLDDLGLSSAGGVGVVFGLVARWVVCGGSLLLGSLILFTWWRDASEGLRPPSSGCLVLDALVLTLAFCRNQKKGIDKYYAVHFFP